MKFESLYSSSAGNLYRVIADTGEQLIIDPGVTWNKLIRAIDFKLNNIIGCLVSHRHKDHSRSQDEMLINGIVVFSELSEVSFEHIKLKPFDIFPFPVKHDVPNTGFIIKADKESLFFAVDCSNIEYEFGLPFTYIAIGCSYDIEVLKKREREKTINRYLAERLLKAHMEKGKVIKYITEKCNLSQCKAIYLIHMSRDNIERENTRLKVQLEINKRTGRAIPVYAAKP